MNLNEIKKAIPFAIASQRQKCLGIPLTRGAQGLCTENNEISNERN